MVITNLKTITTDINVDNTLLDDTTKGSSSLKNRIKLTTSRNNWDITNRYFHSNLPASQISEKDTEETIKHLYETIITIITLKVILD